MTKKKSDDKGKDEKKKDDKKVSITLFSFSGDTLRSFTSEPDTGINYVNWYFDTKGTRYPTMQERKPDADEPGGGVQVAPGKYKVVYQFNEFRDSSIVEVKSDPRIPWNNSLYEKNKIYYDRMKAMVKIADDGFEQLKAAKKNIELVKSALVNVPDSLKKDIDARGDFTYKEYHQTANAVYGYRQ